MLANTLNRCCVSCWKSCIRGTILKLVSRGRFGHQASRLFVPELGTVTCFDELILEGLPCFPLYSYAARLYTFLKAMLHLPEILSDSSIPDLNIKCIGCFLALWEELNWCLRCCLHCCLRSCLRWRLIETWIRHCCRAHKTFIGIQLI